MKKKPTSKAARSFDKHLFEAGQQCHKRLYLDFHDPVEVEPGATRQLMSEIGAQLLALARGVFPKGVQIEGKDAAAAAEATRKQLEAGTDVLFGATFVAEGIEARSDILVRHRDGQLDLYEVKSGTRIKHRYVNDLALQTRVAELCGQKIRAAFLLHLNPAYAHKEGAEYPPMQLLRSADVTTKVRKQVELVTRRLALFRQVLEDKAVLELPMGTFCTVPFPCPHISKCKKQAPEHPLHELPELTRALEVELHKEGIEDLTGIDPNRSGLTFRQRRTLACIKQGTPIIEPFVREELLQCTRPLHFLGLVAITEPLPRFEGQRPWRRLPIAWAVNTLHADGRVESASFVHVDRTDPRSDFVTKLAKHLEVGGTIMCWNCEEHEEMRILLDDLPSAKAAVRSMLGHPHVDMMHLFDSGVFHPQLRNHADLRASVQVLLGDKSGAELAAHSEDDLRALLTKAGTPRVRSATKEKIAADVKASVVWISDRLLRLFHEYAGVEPTVREATPKAAKSATAPKPKPLPKP